MISLAYFSFDLQGFRQLKERFQVPGTRHGRIFHMHKGRGMIAQPVSRSFNHVVKRFGSVFGLKE